MWVTQVKKLNQAPQSAGCLDPHHASRLATLGPSQQRVNKLNRYSTHRNLATAIAVFFVSIATSSAAPVSFQVGMNISTAYDYANSRFTSISPLVGTLGFTFDDAGVTTICGTPGSCSTQTVFSGGLSSTSSFSALIPPSFGQGLGSPTVYYAPEVVASDYYSGVFDWANAGATVFDTSSGEYLTRVIYVTVLKIRSDTTTYGSAADFLRGALDRPSAFQVIAGDGWYASRSAAPTSGEFTQGFDWRDYSAVMTSVNGQGSNLPPFGIPEPSSALMAGIGLFALFAVGFRQKKLATTLANKRCKGRTINHNTDA